MSFWKRNRVRLVVSPQTYDELAGMVAADEDGDLHMMDVRIVRGDEPAAPPRDPVAEHYARCLAPKGPK